MTSEPAPSADASRPSSPSSALRQASTPNTSSDPTSTDATPTATWDQQVENATQAVQLVPQGPVRHALTHLLNLILSNAIEIDLLDQNKMDMP